MLKSRSN